MLPNAKYNFSTRVYPVKSPQVESNHSPFEYSNNSHTTKKQLENPETKIKTRRKFASNAKPQRLFQLYRASNHVETADSSLRELRELPRQLPTGITQAGKNMIGFESYPSFHDAWDQATPGPRANSQPAALEDNPAPKSLADLTAGEKPTHEDKPGDWILAEISPQLEPNSKRGGSIKRQTTDKTESGDWSKVVILSPPKRRIAQITPTERLTAPTVDLGVSFMPLLQDERSLQPQEPEPVSDEFKIPYTESIAEAYLQNHRNLISQHKTLHTIFRFTLQASVLFTYLMVPLK